MRAIHLFSQQLSNVSHVFDALIGAGFSGEQESKVPALRGFTV